MRTERERMRAIRKNRRNTLRYDAGHRMKRATYAPFVEAGIVRCARGASCLFATGDLGGIIEPGTPWDLGHPDGESEGGPEHAICNRGAPHRNKTSRRW